MKRLILPGLIDPHVHLRDPGQTNKEDFYTGTSAALAGGYTTVIDMPNNKIPITTMERLDEKIKIAKKKIVCDVGFYFGSVGDNLEEFEKIKNKVMGLKLYLNETTGSLKISSLNLLEKIFRSWSSAKIISSQSMSLHSSILLTKKIKPILVHAQGERVKDVINVVRAIKMQSHFCHISTASDLKQIIKAKEENLPITCGVTPHHLLLTEKDAKKLGPFGKMKPPLTTQKDQDFLWKNLKYIDVIESDHAPHTIEEKQSEGWRAWGTPIEHPQGSASWRRPRTSDGGNDRQDPERNAVPFGVPGLETTLPLLLTAVSENRLAIEDIIRLCFENPARIFGVGRNCVSRIEVDLNKTYTIDSRYLLTKCKWSPFDGWKVKGKMQRVFIRGKKVFENDKVLVKPGFGEIVYPSNCVTVHEFPKDCHFEATK